MITQVSLDSIENPNMIFFLKETHLFWVIPKCDNINNLTFVIDL